VRCLVKTPWPENVRSFMEVPETKKQRRLGLLEPDLNGDEGRIGERSVLETKELGAVGPFCHSQREPGKRRQCGGDADVRAERSAAMDVGGRIGRGQAEKSCDDLYCFSRRIVVPIGRVSTSAI